VMEGHDFLRDVWLEGIIRIGQSRKLVGHFLR